MIDRRSFSIGPSACPYDSARNIPSTIRKLRIDYKLPKRT